MRGLGRPIGAVDTRRRTCKPIQATRLAGIDYSIPEDSDHAKHLRQVFAASRLGFTWLVKGTA